MKNKNVARTVTIIFALLFVISLFVGCSSGTVYKEVNGKGTITITSSTNATLKDVTLNAFNGCYLVNGKGTYVINGTNFAFTLKSSSISWLANQTLTGTISTDGKTITACGFTYKKK